MKHIILLTALIGLVFITGCRSTKTINYFDKDGKITKTIVESDSMPTAMAKTVHDKNINFEFTLYALRAKYSDITANMTPIVELGFGTVKYKSVPMLAGQPYYVREVVSSWFGSITETTIWIGRASKNSVLTYEAVPNTMIQVSANGIKSGITTVELKETDSAVSETENYISKNNVSTTSTK